MTTGNLVLPAFEAAGIAQETTSQDILAAITGLATETTLGDVYSTATGISATADNIYAEATGTNSKLDNIYATATGIDATVTKLKKWPYATYDTIVSSYSSGTFTDTVTFKSGGATGTTVGTITTVYADAAKNPPSTTTYSPVKVV